MPLKIILSNINYLAVLVTGIIHTVLGLVWFMPGFFGKQWMELTKQDLKPARQWIPAGIIGHQMIAFVLAIVVYLSNATTMFEGFVVGVLVWIGFFVTLEIGELIWEKIPFKLFAIRVGYHFLALSISGVLLSIWR
jgi:hypothetical protein